MIIYQVEILFKVKADFRKFFDIYHPKMVEFIGEAIKYYADKNL